MLRSLLGHRELLDYPDFRREFTDHATRLNPKATESAPTKAVYEAWLNDHTKAPRDGFRRQVLESMFPGISARQLFEPVETLPNPDLTTPNLAKPTQDRKATTSEQEARWVAACTELITRLRDLRTRASLSQSALAKCCMFDRSHLSKTEAGHGIPSRQFWTAVDRQLQADGSLVELYDRVRSMAPRTTPGPVDMGQLTPHEQLAATLRELRTRADLSQTALAEQCAIDRSYLCKTERGHDMPSRRFWVAADQALDAEGALVEMYDQVQALTQPARTPPPASPSIRPAPERVRALMSWIESPTPARSVTPQQPALPTPPAMPAPTVVQSGTALELGREQAWEMSR